MCTYGFATSTSCHFFVIYMFDLRNLHVVFGAFVEWQTNVIKASLNLSLIHSSSLMTTLGVGCAAPMYIFLSYVFLKYMRVIFYVFIEDSEYSGVSICRICAFFANWFRENAKCVLAKWTPIFQKHSINFTNVSSDLNIFYTVVNLNVNTVHSGCW